MLIVGVLIVVSVIAIAVFVIVSVVVNGIEEEIWRIMTYDKKRQGGTLLLLNRAYWVEDSTRDPELRSNRSGKAVTSFNLAVERNFKSDDQEADFINCVCCKIAENTERYCL